MKKLSSRLSLKEAVKKRRDVNGMPLETSVLLLMDLLQTTKKKASNTFDMIKSNEK